MKKWLAVLPVAAAGAGVAAFLLAKKGKADVKPAPKAEAKPEKKAAPAAIKNAKTEVYSFASGYKDAKTVSVGVTFDGEACTYHQEEENFLCETGDSHVGILDCEKFSLQVEYAPYYNGESFEAMAKAVEGKFKNVARVKLGAYDAVRFEQGFSCCFALPATDMDYVLISAVYTCSQKDREKEGPLADNPKLLAILNAVTVKAE